MCLSKLSASAFGQLLDSRWIEMHNPLHSLQVYLPSVLSGLTKICQSFEIQFQPKNYFKIFSKGLYSQLSVHLANFKMLSAVLRSYSFVFDVIFSFIVSFRSNYV